MQEPQENQSDSSQDDEIEAISLNDVNESNNVEEAERNDELEQLQVGTSSNVETRARRRRFSSQRTFSEDPLDNDVNNRQQQFELMIEDSDDDMDIEASDRLFEEYLKQNNTNAAEDFNTELPTQHSYLGTMDPVSGLIYFEVDKIYKIPISPHHSLIFPGEIVPMIIAESFFDDSIFGTDGTNEGLVFGLIFLENTQKEKAKEIVYGVTCQVYERGVDDLGHITLKSRAHQRFKVIPQKDGSLTTSVQSDHHRKYYALVKILPEIVLPDPIISLNSSNNLLKYLNNSSQYNKIKSRMASVGVWPKFVYDQYETVSVMQKVKRFLEFLRIASVPTDLIGLSFWLARNTPLSVKERQKIFILNCVNKRLLIIGKSLNLLCNLTCKRCKNKIAAYKEIFAMSKNGVQSNYCNPAGYIHETLTVYKIIDNALQMVQRPSTEFSWFPGYAWQIAVCSNCSVHIGWKFIAVNKNLRPKTFFGLSGKSISVDTNKDDDDSDGETQTVRFPRNAIFDMEDV